MARHLDFDIEDTSTDHPARVRASEVDATLQDRLRAMRTVTALSASEILDVDCSTKESMIIVKTRKGLTTFGEGLADDEIQCLHAIVRRALAG